MSAKVQAIALLQKTYLFAQKVLDTLTPAGELAARIWVAQIFFNSGLLKIASWDSTIMLFTYEFNVPILSPYLAAVSGTCMELVLPVLLVLGLGGRLVTAVFFIYNLIAVMSYPLLWTADGAQGLAQHINWGLILALLMFHGSGKWSLDYLWQTKFAGKTRK